MPSPRSHSLSPPGDLGVLQSLQTHFGYVEDMTTPTMRTTITSQLRPLPQLRQVAHQRSLPGRQSWLHKTHQCTPPRGSLPRRPTLDTRSASGNAQQRSSFVPRMMFRPKSKLTSDWALRRDYLVLRSGTQTSGSTGKKSESTAPPWRRLLFGNWMHGRSTMTRIASPKMTSVPGAECRPSCTSWPTKLTRT
jgi:hypothetical protein